MSKLILPNAGETVELGAELIRERILERITELENERKVLGEGVGPKGKALKSIDPALYRAFSKIKVQLKSLRRGLGGLLTMDPDAVVNPKTKETWGMLVKEIVNENITGQALADRLKKFGKFVYTESNVFKGKVGHHRTALNILRDILQDKPFEFRTKFKDLAKKAGYMIGEEFIDFIDPASHNYFSTNVQGVLLDKLGITNKKQLPPKLVEALADRYAHALRFGSGSGVEVPANFLKSDVNVDSLFAFARPYLEGARRGADAALELDAIISGDNWETADDLIEAINKVKIRDTSDLLDWRGRPIFKQTKADKLSKASALGPDRILLTEGVEPGDISDTFLKENHLFRNTLKPVFTKVKELSQTTPGRVIGSTLTGTARFATKAAAGIDPLQGAVGIHTILSNVNPAEKLLGFKDVVEGGLGTAAWWNTKLLNPLGIITAGSVIGQVEEGGARKIRKVTGDENFVTGFGTHGTIVNQQNPFGDLFKKKEEEEEKEEVLTETY